jgi:predicted Zn-dependent protease
MRTRGALIAVAAFAFFAQAQIRNPLAKRPAEPSPAKFDREFYEQMKNFAEGLYKQPDREDFRITVDRKYEELLRDHGRRAFEMNTSAKSEIRVVNEDRFRIFSGLYDNLAIQELVNQVGQEVTPKASDKLFAFKLVADPIPRAESLATGTIYVTTGLVALLDNKAQLAYVLAHEAGHVAKDHWKQRVMVELAKEEYARRSAENQQKITSWGALIGLGASAPGISTVQLPPTEIRNMDWNAPEEDEADEIAMQSLLDAKINVTEVPKLYVALDKSSMKDDRVGMGFWGNRVRMRERLAKVQDTLDGPMKATIASTKLTGDGPEFRKLIAELKRDNGVLAFEYDMLEVARDNLEQAVEARGEDATALYFYGKVLMLVGKTDADRAKANDMFRRAMEADHRNYAYGAYLHSAVPFIDTKDPAEQKIAIDYLKEYVANYAKAQQDAASARGKVLPPHIETIYDYMARLGNTKDTFSDVLQVSDPPKPVVEAPPPVKPPSPVTPPPPPDRKK